MNEKKRKPVSAKKYKIILSLFIAVLVILVIVLVSVENAKTQDEAIEVYNTTAVEETTTEEAQLEPTESETVKNAVQSVMSENALDESNFSFFYYNIDTQEYYFYNEDKYFTAASTVKVPIAMLYYDMINGGEISDTDTLTYTSDCYEAGDGLTASTYSVSSEVPINFLLEQSIVNSDNTAVNILIKNLGYTNCREMIAEYAPDIDFPDDFFTSNITCAEYGYTLMSYLYENMDDYEALISDMKESSYGEYLKKYLDVDVAHKYGSYNSCVHDYGIVFDDTTYLIGVYTEDVADAAELIAQISLEVNNII